MGGRLLKANKETKAEVKVDNAEFFFQLSDYAAEVFYQFFLKVIKIMIKSFCT